MVAKWFFRKAWFYNNGNDFKQWSFNFLPSPILYIKSRKIMRKQYHCHLHLVSYCLFIKFVRLKGVFYWESCFFSIMLELIFSLTLRVIVNKLLYSFNLYFRSDFFYKITWEKINSSWMLNTTLVWSCKARIVNCTLSIRVLRTKL